MNTVVNTTLLNSLTLEFIYYIKIWYISLYNKKTNSSIFGASGIMIQFSIDRSLIHSINHYFKLVSNQL